MANNIEPTRFEILELIPQRPPFVMVSRLMSYSEMGSTTEFTVPADNVFCRDGFLSEYGVVENIAQSCAARIGYRNLIENRPINLGFIGAVKGLKIMGRAPIGQTLFTKIEVVSEVFSMMLIAATVECEGSMIASCEMKISLSDIEV